jgi:lipopolysaccharide export system protein LptA
MQFQALVILVLTSVFALQTSAQTPEKKDKKSKESKVEILHADDFIFDEQNGVKARRLIGNVRIKHNESIMHCDSAYVFNETNTVKAYGNVRITDDTEMEVTGDSLIYDGEQRIARLRGREVKLIKDDMVLTTRFLDFDRQKNVARYWDGGVILMNKGADTLTSRLGYYYPDIDEARFKDSVVMRNKDYFMVTDTMNQQLKKELTFFFGPTYIYQDSNRIYAERGRSNQKNKISVFVQCAHISTPEQEFFGDSIIYDNKKEIAEAFGNIELQDTANKVFVYGQYALHKEKDSTTLVLGNPMLLQIVDGDSLYLHADTLFSTYDTSRQYRQMSTWPKAQFYKKDMQGKCDSLVMSDVDSTIRMYRDPVLWSEENQLTADFIVLYRTDTALKYMRLNNNAFIVSLNDTVVYRKYNQIKGDSMIGYFTKGELTTVDVLHNGNTIYFPKDEKDGWIGMNKATAAYMTVYLDSQQVKQIFFKNTPDATLYPIKDVNPDAQYLPGFSWRQSERPLQKEDIFRWVNPPVQQDEKGKRRRKKDKI